MTIRSLNLKTLASATAIAAVVGTSGAFVAANGPAPAFAATPPAGGYVDLVSRVAPAVVTIEVEKKMDGMQGANMRPGSPFDDFARRFGMPMPNMPGEPGGLARGVGTGFIISGDGQIVTNAHVVDGSDKVTVKLDNGQTYEAKVLGSDAATDIAVLKIDASDLPHVQFGDSTELHVGEPVIAMGNPLGLGNTVTTGIVSALGRDIQAGPFDNFIQTDAAINRGNSGGPLFNEAGDVVGINTAIMSPDGGSIGIGFAVPSEMATDIVADLAGDGKIDRGFLGVQISPVSEETAAALGFDAPKGAMIVDVTDDSAAQSAGLKKGDIVLSVNGDDVGSPRDLTRKIAGDAPGTKVDLNLLRAGKPMDVSVTLGNRAEQPA